MQFDYSYVYSCSYIYICINEDRSFLLNNDNRKKHRSKTRHKTVEENSKRRTHHHSYIIIEKGEGYVHIHEKTAGKEGLYIHCYVLYIRMHKAFFF